MPFDLIAQNTASKEIYLVSGLTDTSNTSLSYLFENFEMPISAQDGEYNCVLFRNGRMDVEYEFNTELLSSVAHTQEGDIEFKYLRPEVFLMKYGKVETNYAYQKTDKIYAYRKK